MFLTVFVADGVFFTHHTFQLEMWHFWATLNTREPWIYTGIHMGSCHAISPTWKTWCTLNHFYFSNTALKRSKKSKSSWDTSTLRCFLTSGLSPRPPNVVYCNNLVLILCSNIGRARRQQSVPTILTETAGSLTKWFTERSSYKAKLLHKK